MNARNIIVESLTEWGFDVLESEGVDIMLGSGSIIEVLPISKSVLIDRTVYEADDDDDYFELVEAANALNDEFLLHTHFSANEDFMEANATIGFDYSGPQDLKYKLHKAILTSEYLPQIYEATLNLIKESHGEEVDIKPIWDAVKNATDAVARTLLEGKTILYIHGFASSGNSGTAAEIQRLLPGSRVLSPDLPLEPFAAYSMLCEILDTADVDVIVGTSMGGMFANSLSGVPKVLVNPSFHVSESMRKKIGIVKFFKKRADGAVEFEVTEELCDVYEKFERKQFAFIHERDTGETFGLFGTQDDVVDCKDEFMRYFGDAYLNIYCGHRLTNETIRQDLIPTLAELVARNS